MLQTVQKTVQSWLGMRRDVYRRNQPLILINGLAEQGESWFRNRDHWQRHFDVRMPGILVYDGPVIQQRMQNREPVNVAFLTDRLEAYLDNFVQEPPYHLVASSLGGQVAVEYCARHPDKVERMVLLCPSGMGCEEKLPLTEGARHHNYQGLVESVFYDRRLASPGVVEYYARKFASRNWRKAIFQTVRGTKSHSVNDRLPKVKRPTLVICGREDRIVDPYHVERVVSGLPNFRFIMLDRCGHAPQLEMPRVVNRLVTDFLCEQPAEVAAEVAAC
jgi:pimeloyl-ACP methyl ester carboxylesterase